MALGGGFGNPGGGGGGTIGTTAGLVAAIDALRRTDRSIFGGRVPVMTRAQAYANTGGATGTLFTSTARTHWWAYTHTAIVDCGDISFVYGNFLMKPPTGSNDGEGDVGNDFWVASAMFFNSQRWNFNFAGKRFALVRHSRAIASSPIIPLPIVITDPMGFTLNAGDTIGSNSIVMVNTVGDKIPTSLTTQSGLNEGIISGDWNLGQAAGGSGSTGFGPVAIIGSPLKGTIYSFAICGDSLAQGAGDTGATERGMFELGLANYPRIRITGSGAKARMWGSTVTQLAKNVGPALAGSCRVSVLEQGVNDVNANDSDSTVKANMLAWAKAAIINGAENIAVTTITPSTLSKDAWATIEGQTIGIAGSTPAAQRISACTNATPAVCTTNAAHGQVDGNQIYLNGVGNIPDGLYFVKETTFTTTTFGVYLDAGLTQPVTSSGSFTSATSAFATAQAITNETSRTAYNTYLRSAQFPIDIAAIRSTVIGTCIDIAGSFEVNRAGAVTLNGGFWPASGTTDGLHPNTTIHTSCGVVIQAYADGLAAGAV